MRTPEAKTLEEKLIEKFDFVRITFDKGKKRPWRVAIWKCKRCRETFVSYEKIDALKSALEWGER